MSALSACCIPCPPPHQLLFCLLQVQSNCIGRGDSSPHSSLTPEGSSLDGATPTVAGVAQSKSRARAATGKEGSAVPAALSFSGTAGRLRTYTATRSRVPSQKPCVWCCTDSVPEPQTLLVLHPCILDCTSVELTSVCSPPCAIVLQRACWPTSPSGAAPSPWPAAHASQLFCLRAHSPLAPMEPPYPAAPQAAL